MQNKADIVNGNEYFVLVAFALMSFRCMKVSDHVTNYAPNSARFL